MRALDPEAACRALTGASPTGETTDFPAR
jgi:hypothetical protein